MHGHVALARGNRLDERVPSPSHHTPGNFCKTTRPNKHNRKKVRPGETCYRGEIRRRTRGTRKGCGSCPSPGELSTDTSLGLTWQRQQQQQQQEPQQQQQQRKPVRARVSRSATTATTTATSAATITAATTTTIATTIITTTITPTTTTTTLLLPLLLLLLLERYTRLVAITGDHTK